MNHVTKFRVFLLSALSSLLLILSFPKFNIEILAWFGFVPLLFAIEKKSKAKAFLLSYLCGVIFWCGTIYWLIHVTLPGTILLILYLALYFAIFGLIVSTIDQRAATIGSLIIPSVWVILEYIRSHLFSGFPWALLGYSQCLNLPIIQIADITGVWGVSFLVMLVNATIYIWVTRSGGQQVTRIKTSILPLLCIVLVLCYGYYKLYQSPGQAVSRSPIRISVIQGNIPQELKWNPGAKDYIVNKYLELSSLAVKDKPDLLIWPEAALPVILEEEPLFFEQVKDFVRGIKTPLLLGAVTLRGNLYYNSALLVSGAGQTLTRYDKLHLVPFGEYIPLKKILPFLETVVPIGDITSGKEYTIFKIPNPCLPDRQAKSQIPNKSQIPDYRPPAGRAGPGRPNPKITNSFAVLICFEDLFPELSREFIKKGAEFLVNITNDAWYKKTSAAYQHLQASVFRAVENRIYLVRAANTGVSGFIAPSGKIISLVQDKNGRGIFIDGYKTEDIAVQKRHSTFYTRYGNIFPVICFLFMLYGIVLPFKKKR